MSNFHWTYFFIGCWFPQGWIFVPKKYLPTYPENSIFWVFFSVTVLQHGFIPCCQLVYSWFFIISTNLKPLNIPHWFTFENHFYTLINFWKDMTSGRVPLFSEHRHLFNSPPLPCTFPQAASSYGTSKLVLRFSVNPWELPPKRWLEIGGVGT